MVWTATTVSAIQYMAIGNGELMHECFPKHSPLTNQNTTIINKIWQPFIRNGKSTMKFNKKNGIQYWKNDVSSTLPRWYWDIEEIDIEIDRVIVSNCYRNLYIY